VISPDDFAKLSRSLASSLPNEPRLRCALGRAYYAAYHYCLKCADTYCGELTPAEAKDQGLHSKLYLRLEGHSKSIALDSQLRTIASHAKELRNLRVRSDYHLDNDTLTERDLSLFSAIPSTNP
jgi:hypothetical protein